MKPSKCLIVRLLVSTQIFFLKFLSKNCCETKKSTYLCTPQLRQRSIRKAVSSDRVSRAEALIYWLKNKFFEVLRNKETAFLRIKTNILELLKFEVIIQRRV